MPDHFLVRDNYLSRKAADELQDLMFGAFFPWYFLDNTTFKGGKTAKDVIDIPMHVHNMFYAGKVNNPGYKQILETFGWNEKSLMRIKVNMVMPRLGEKRHTPFHVDNEAKHFTVVYYVNDSEGETILKTPDGIKQVVPKKGRVVMFAGDLLHAHYLPQRRPRCVMNFNFTEPLKEMLGFDAANNR